MNARPGANAHVRLAYQRRFLDCGPGNRISRLRAIIPLIGRAISSFANRRELFLSGLRLAAGELT
jgi:hypothetical protein